MACKLPLVQQETVLSGADAFPVVFKRLFTYRHAMRTASGVAASMVAGLGPRVAALGSTALAWTLGGFAVRTATLREGKAARHASEAGSTTNRTTRVASTAALLAAFCLACAAPSVWAQNTAAPGSAPFGTVSVSPALPNMPADSVATTPARSNSSSRPVGGISAVGPGDTLQVTVFGQPELSATITVSVAGNIVVPVVGSIAVNGMSPATVAGKVAAGLRSKNYLQDPQVSVEVLQVRSQMTSILGEVMRPGRYPLEGELSLLELLAMAGGLKETADDTAVLLRKSTSPNAVEPGASQSRLELYVGGRQALSRAVQDVPLVAGDVVYIGPAKRFFIYGEVARAGAYPMEDGLTVMRAVSLGGGLSQRASERRITINRKVPGTEREETLKATLTDPVLPGDVIHVDERFF